MDRLVILCVDDEVLVLESLKFELRETLLAENIHFEMAESGEAALAVIDEIAAAGDHLALVISDQKMPGMKGDELLLEVQCRSPETLKILLTGYSDLGAIRNAINNAGLYRYVTKPWETNDLLLTVSEACRKFRLARDLEAKNRRIEKLTLAMLAALESANYYNDEDTGEHIRRVARYSAVIAREAGFDEAFVRRIEMYAPLHDLGKVGVRREILGKPGKYEPEEFEEMKRHVRIGHSLLDNPAIDGMASNIALYHHECWDGSGYAAGLAGTAIPVEARIVAIADVFDALISKRVYKPAFTLEQAMAEMLAARGTKFDPDLLDIFAASRELVYWIAVKAD